MIDCFKHCAVKASFTFLAPCLAHFADQICAFLWKVHLHTGKQNSNNTIHEITKDRHPNRYNWKTFCLTDTSLSSLLLVFVSFSIIRQIKDQENTSIFQKLSVRSSLFFKSRCSDYLSGCVRFFGGACCFFLDLKHLFFLVQVKICRSLSA